MKFLDAIKTKFYRTFASAEVPVLVTGLAALQSATKGLQDVKVFVLGSIAAVIAALSATFLAMAGFTADSALGKSVAQALQVFGSGLATVYVADLTSQAAFSALDALGPIAALAVGSGLLSFLTLTKGAVTETA